MRPVTGDCVSRGQSHAAIASLASAVKAGNSGWPDIPDYAYKSGMPFHPTPTYWEKKGGQSGWSCSSAAARSKDKTGLALAIDYPGTPVGDLLLKYNTSVISKYCKTGAPQNVIDVLNGHKTLSYSRTSTSKLDEIMDALANGYGINSCGSQGFGKGSGARNSHGVCKRSGSWSHSMATIGYDDTEWAHKNYGGTLLLILNSWGNYLGGTPPHVHGDPSLPRIPKGSFWCKAKDYSGRDSYVISALNGFPKQKMKDWNLRDLI